MKGKNKAISGLLAGAAIGAITFMFVKPKINNKKPAENKGEEVILTQSENPDNLFI